jgi:hypothetical protein
VNRPLLRPKSILNPSKDGEGPKVGIIALSDSQGTSAPPPHSPPLGWRIIILSFDRSMAPEALAASADASSVDADRPPEGGSRPPAWTYECADPLFAGMMPSPDPAYACADPVAAALMVRKR